MTGVKIFSVSGQRLPIFGKKHLPVSIGEVETEEEFFFVRMQVPLLKYGEDSAMKEIEKNRNTLVPDHLQDLHQRCSINLSVEQKKTFAQLLTEFADVFAKDSEDVGKCDVVCHKIDTGDSLAIKQAPRRLPLHRRLEVDELLSKMERQGVIEKSQSPWSSPVVLFKKKDGSIRFCVDYRRLNNITKKDSYPLPRIEDTLDALDGSCWFSAIDLQSGYWQISMDPVHKEKTAFCVGTGLWQFKVMPFGLCNAPATFERLMDNVLRGLNWKICLVYLDDIIIFGRSFEKEVLWKVLAPLRKASLLMSPMKCNFFCKGVKYLGHVVSEMGVQTDPEKLDAVKNWPVPKNKTELESFLGLCTLLSEQGRERVIAYFSKTLGKAEKNCCVTRKELLAIVKSIEHFHHYLYGCRFLLRTDHAALRWLLSFKNPEGQVARWIERIQGYEFEVKHREGRLHQNADGLSRRPCESQDSAQCKRLEEKTEENGDWRRKQEEDEEIGFILSRKKEGRRPDWQEISDRNTRIKYLVSNWDSLEVYKDLLFRKWESLDGKSNKWLLMVPREMVSSVMTDCHDTPAGGHFGVNKTLDSARKYGCSNHQPKKKGKMSQVAVRVGRCVRGRVLVIDQSRELPRSLQVRSSQNFFKKETLKPQNEELRGSPRPTHQQPASDVTSDEDQAGNRGIDNASLQRSPPEIRGTGDMGVEDFIRQEPPQPKSVKHGSDKSAKEMQNRSIHTPRGIMESGMNFAMPSKRSTDYPLNAGLCCKSMKKLLCEPTSMDCAKNSPTAWKTRCRVISRRHVQRRSQSSSATARESRINNETLHQNNQHLIGAHRHLVHQSDHEHPSQRKVNEPQQCNAHIVGDTDILRPTVSVNIRIFGYVQIKEDRHRAFGQPKQKQSKKIDTGADINLMKENAAQAYHRYAEVKKFTMGNSTYTCREALELTIFGKTSKFHVITKECPLVEDGIVELPFLDQYNWKLTKENIQLDNKSLKLHTENAKIPAHTSVMVCVTTPTKNAKNGQISTYVTNASDSEREITDDTFRVTKIDVKEDHQKNNDTSIAGRVKLLRDNTRLQHIEADLRYSIWKILASYSDVFHLPGDELPQTRLTEHRIELTDKRPINIMSYRPPEAHKHEIRKQRMMDQALRGLIGKTCFVYLDDIVVYGSTIQEHNENLVILLERLRATGLKLQPDKCELLRPELEFFGYTITKDGVKPNEVKIEAVRNYKQPSTPKEVKGFLGLAGYYRKFIKDFSKIAKPLIDLTKQDKQWEWTEECQHAFDTLKQHLTKSPVLRYPNSSEQFTLTTDASNYGIGAVLSQEGHPCC
ncbi:uncharacterized protein LOC143261038 [Megalopta genalis]|uniref:uncharacterized protein LOC143261038 n=1 Tax=Megalopta genalis TaxID=115081 RepID=UPI003FD2E6A3